MFNFSTLIAICILLPFIFGAPYQDQSYSNRNSIDEKEPQVKNANRDTKKDIFLSRGWGAGGMPFSVLYMNPTFSSNRPMATVQTKVTNQSNYQRLQSQQLAKNPNRSMLQVRTAMRQKTFNRNTPHSVIPQLFVSYGWGPLGK